MVYRSREDAGEDYGAIYEIEHEILFDLDEERTDQAKLKESLVFYIRISRRILTIRSWKVKTFIFIYKENRHMK